MSADITIVTGGGALPTPPTSSATGVDAGLAGLVLKQDRHREGRPNTGSSVKNGKIRFSSVSQIKLFDAETEGGCARKWSYSYIFGKKPKQLEAQTEGTDHASKLEHYLKTGELNLPPVLLQGLRFLPTPGSDLEVEEFFAVGQTQEERGQNLLKAILLRDSYNQFARRDTAEAASLVTEMKRLAVLTIAGVPIDGAADFRHRRGQYVDSEGILRHEQPGIVVAETGDHKVTRRINGRWNRDHTEFYPGYAKTDAQVCEDVQMVEYGVHSYRKYSDITHVRLSHIYYSKERKEAAKRTGLISIDTLLRRHERIEGVMREMESVAAGAREPADVAPNVSACSAYTHVNDFNEVVPGCAHRLYCPLSREQVTFDMMGKEFGMSLFDQIPLAGTETSPPAPPAPPPPPTAPLEGAAYDAAVAVERAKLAAEEAGALKSVSYGVSCSACGTALHSANAARLPDGVVKHIGCSTAQAAIPSAVVTIAPPPPGAGPINPPDAVNPTLLESADPMPPEEIAKITDPALRNVVEQHAAEHKEKAARELAVKEAEKLAGGVWCSGSGQRPVVDVELVQKRKMPCPGCGKPIGIKPVKEVNNGVEQWVSSIPRHKPVAADNATNGVPATPVSQPAAPTSTSAPTTSPPSPPAPPAPAAAPTPPAPPLASALFTAAPTIVASGPAAPPPPAPPAPPPAPAVMIASPSPSAIAPAAPQVPRPAIAHSGSGVFLYVNVLVERGEQLLPLEDYYRPILAQLEKQFEVVDIRIAKKDSPLAYGGWRGALSAKCRENLPPPGKYYARAAVGDDLVATVIDALAPLCDAVYRGC